MIVRISVWLLLVLCCAGVELEHKWDLAVAVDNEIELLTRNGTLVGVIPHEFDSLQALTYDEIHHAFIVSNRNGRDDQIYHIDLTKEDSKPTLLVSELPDDVKGIAIDNVNNTVFWTDILHKRIQKTSVNGGEKNVIFEYEQKKPTAITVDKCGRKLYWTNNDISTSTIERSNLDGTNHEIIITRNLFHPTSLTIDPKTNQLYWCDDSEGIYFDIGTANLNGSNHQIIYNGVYNRPKGIAVSDDYIYWTETEYNSLWRLKRGVKDAQPEKIRKFGSDPSDIVFRSAYDCLNHESRTDDLALEKFEPATDSLKCLNSGFLTPHGCHCVKGYTGPQCETSLCHNYCVNGECQILINDTPICKCIEGYTGNRCEKNISDLCTCIDSNGTKTKCNCVENKNYYHVITENKNNETRVEALSSLESHFGRLNDPIMISSWILTVIMFGVNAGLVFALCRLKNKRPRIKKRIIVNRNITPLTYRPRHQSESCEITIENCCNMNICETPCFEPPKLGSSQYKKSEDKKTLLASMENGEDVY